MNILKIRLFKYITITRLKSELYKKEQSENVIFTLTIEI
jgi:hypothetical protein